MSLNRVIGPPCPDCGCEASAVLRVTDWFGTKMERRACDGCGREFNVKVDQELASADVVKDSRPKAEWKVNRCVHCDSEHIKVTHTRGKIRYCACRACEKRFKLYATA